MNDSDLENVARNEPAEKAAAQVVLDDDVPSTSSLFLKVFPSIMLPMFLAVADQTIVATALPAIASSLGEIERASWVVVSYLIANTIAAPVYGRLGDTFGRRSMMLVALAIFVIGSVLCAISPNIELSDRSAGIAGLWRRRLDDAVASADRRNHSAARARQISGLPRRRLGKLKHVRTGCRRLSYRSLRLAIDLPCQHPAWVHCCRAGAPAWRGSREIAGARPSIFPGWYCS